MEITKKDLKKLIKEFLDTSIVDKEQEFDFSGLDIDDIENDIPTLDDTGQEYSASSAQQIDLSNIQIPEPDYEAAQREILEKMSQPMR